MQAVLRKLLRRGLSSESRSKLHRLPKAAPRPCVHEAPQLQQQATASAGASFQLRSSRPLPLPTFLLRHELEACVSNRQAPITSAE